jgi:hypothetical protein
MNPRYVAWAKLHGRTPEEQFEVDRNDWPGGCMAGFCLWIQEQARAFDATRYPLARLCEPDEFTAFLVALAEG